MSETDPATTPSECLFCRIVSGEIHAEIVADSEHSVAIRDVDPKAPTHLWCVPRRHVENAVELANAAPEELGDLIRLAGQVAGVEELTAYRVVVNVGADAGQKWPHLCLHLLGGRHLAWPPG